MKVSLNWVKEFTDIKIETGDLLQKIGAQLGAIEDIDYVGKKYQGALIAEVLSCEPHPNADRLKVCVIDDGNKHKSVERDEDNRITVVCGAPNVKAGQLVVWLPPGAIVPSTFAKDPFVLEAREIRGVRSNGMIASLKELGISDDHDGIAVLEKGRPGDHFAEAYGLDDIVIDIENKMFTHRPDCFGIIGVAREIAGILGESFESPRFYSEPVTTGPYPSDESLLSIKIKIPEHVPRFMARVVRNVKSNSSPLELQVKLMKVGLKPINQIVDITNYAMYLTGQPLHAYDYDKLAARTAGDKSPVLIIRKPVDGETLHLINGKKIDLEKGEGILIADEAGPIGLGGVMGGAETEVDESTKNIILEAATFDMYAIRRSSMRYGIFSDAATRFSKGQSPHQNDRVLAWAVRELKSLQPDAEPARSIYDEKVSIKKNKAIKTSVDFINSRLGTNLRANKITDVLNRVEFKIHEEAGAISATAPFWRTDIEIAEDLVEEVGRLIGYDQLPTILPTRTITSTRINEEMELKSKIRELLSGLGANEVMTYSFVHGDLLNKCGQKIETAYKLSNALSPNLQYYRLSITPSLLQLIHPNLKAGYDDFVLYEIGKSHNKSHRSEDSSLPKEYSLLSLVIGSKAKHNGATYYRAKSFLEELAGSLGLNLEFKPIKNKLDFSVVKPFDLRRSALVYGAGTDIALGIVGEFNESVRSGFKLPIHSAGFEIGLKELLLLRDDSPGYRPLSKFPSVGQDVCLQVKVEVSYSEVKKLLLKALEDRLISQAMEVSVAPIDIYSADELAGSKRITFHVTLNSNNRTLTGELLNRMLDESAQDLSKSIGARRI